MNLRLLTLVQKNSRSRFSGSHIGFSRWLPLQYNFNIYQDISHNQKHKFRHKVCDCACVTYRRVNMWHIQLGLQVTQNGWLQVLEPAILKTVTQNGVEGWEKLNPNIFGLFEPQLSQKANKINFGNKNGKNDITHQTNRMAKIS